MRAKKFKVHEFVVMPNHVHVLLSVGPEWSIEKAVQTVEREFLYRAKKELGYPWEIWQKDFSEVQITTEASFIHHQEYIDKNPVKAGLARSAAESALLNLFKEEESCSG